MKNVFKITSEVDHIEAINEWSAWINVYRDDSHVQAVHIGFHKEKGMAEVNAMHVAGGISKLLEDLGHAVADPELKVHSAKDADTKRVLDAVHGYSDY